MDMEEYFYNTRKNLGDIIKQLEEIEVKEIHAEIKETKKQALIYLKKLYDMHEF
jgi:hypothetical protein